MRRVLFVDDEPAVLDGLRRMLRGMRHEWDMTFVPDARAALSAMDEEPAEIVVTDMKLGGMDGAELLHRIKERWPDSVRIILSGHGEQEAVLKCVGSAHQYLFKPCDPETLKSVIRRAESLRDLLDGSSIRDVIGATADLPTVPEVFQEVVETLQTPNVSLEDVGRVIAKDIGMTAKILRLVNSSSFGLRAPITNIERATIHLGLDTINSLVLGSHAFSVFNSEVRGFSAEEVWRRSLATANGAKRIVREEGMETRLADDAFTAGMLHDVGRLVLADRAGQRYGDVLERAKAERRSVADVEREVLGTTHAEVGAYLIGLWGLPDPVVEAIAYHECPRRAVARNVGPLTFVHVASELVGTEQSADHMDRDYLGDLGLEDRLPRWREICREVVAS